MTKDLALCISGGKEVSKDKYLTTDAFIEKCAQTLRNNLSPKAKL